MRMECIAERASPCSDVWCGKVRREPGSNCAGVGEGAPNCGLFSHSKVLLVTAGIITDYHNSTTC